MAKSVHLPPSENHANSLPLNCMGFTGLGPPKGPSPSLVSVAQEFGKHDLSSPDRSAPASVGLSALPPTLTQDELHQLISTRPSLPLLITAGAIFQIVINRLRIVINGPHSSLLKCTARAPQAGDGPRSCFLLI